MSLPFPNSKPRCLGTEGKAGRQGVQSEDDTTWERLSQGCVNKIRKEVGTNTRLRAPWRVRPSSASAADDQGSRTSVTVCSDWDDRAEVLVVAKKRVELLRSKLIL